ncbi:serine/threonine-protein kinase [Streptomyces sp. NPDC000075]|uniref:serine/threonine-protein kinase n=1 Tax=Streptomyces TaxID=1883 RepID=UPI0031DDFC30
MEAGTRLADRYELVECLGQGGMGQVWQAFDEQLKRAVAVKILLAGREDEKAVSRFRREATIGARLHHPGITVVHDVGHDAGQLFIVMELLNGRDLASLLSESPHGLPIADALSLAIQIIDALAAAHDQGIVHRDLKPANVFLHQGRVKICDFGIARAIDSTAGLTSKNLLLGTPPYMAPEQWRGETVDTRCDLYAYGCLLYAMLTGTTPFTGNLQALMHQHSHKAPAPSRTHRPEIPQALDSLVLALLEKAVEDRPADAHTVHRALAAITHVTEPDTAPQVPQSGGATFVDDLIQQAVAAAESDVVRARDLCAAIVEVATRSLGPDHQSTLRARHYHAVWVGTAGAPARARDLYEALIPDVTRVLGADHFDTLTFRHHHPWWVGEAGDPARARDLYEALIPDLIRVLGPDHPDTLAACCEHARWVGEGGDAARARDLYEALIPNLTRVLGPDHLDALTTRRQHARRVGEAGNPARARDLYEALIRNLTRVLGPDHPDTLRAGSSHAEWVGKAGNPTAARDLGAVLIRDLTRVLGPEHLDTLTARRRHAWWVGKAGNPAWWVGEGGDPAWLVGEASAAATARDLHVTLIRDLTRILGTNHPDTLTARSNHAWWVGEAGNPETARDLHAVLMPHLIRVLGPDHTVTLTARSSRAWWVGVAGNPAAARDLDRRLVSDLTRLLGPVHPDTLTARNRHAWWVGEAGNPAAARDLYAALVSDSSRILGAKHTDTIDFRHNQAYWTREAAQGWET